MSIIGMKWHMRMGGLQFSLKTLSLHPQTEFVTLCGIYTTEWTCK
ncbi:hypothetical protein FACS1894202_14690 [Clostridia bacterium]|nr:hypothetical protein FACS1894202_14690 [Clostridia bacterium]